MSDTPQGEGWWQASDGKYYPPEQAPVGGGGTAGPAVDIGTALSYGWNKFIKYLGQIVVIVLVILAVNIVLVVLGNIIVGTIDNAALSAVLNGLFTVIRWFITLLLAAGVIRAALAITRGEAPEASMLFQTDNLVPYIIGSIIVSVLTFLGFFVFCIGALIVMFFTYFYGFFIIDRGEDGWQGTKSSYEMVKNNAGTVLVYVIVATVLNLITCGLAVGVTYIAGAYVYKTLNGESVAA
jgi:hypothetical protein